MWGWECNQKVWENVNLSLLREKENNNKNDWFIDRYIMIFETATGNLCENECSVHSAIGVVKTEYKDVDVKSRYEC